MESLTHTYVRFLACYRLSQKLNVFKYYLTRRFNKLTVRQAYGSDFFHCWSLGRARKMRLFRFVYLRVCRISCCLFLLCNAYKFIFCFLFQDNFCYLKIILFLLKYSFFLLLICKFLCLSLSVLQQFDSKMYVGRNFPSQHITDHFPVTHWL